MKNRFLSLMNVAIIAMLAVATVMTSCKKDDDDDPIDTPVEDGVYIKGAGTALTELGADGLMVKTKNEVDQTERASLYEMYVPVQAGSDGFNIVIVEGGVETVYGPGSDFALVPEAERDNEQPETDFWRGSYEETETAFTVTADGMYHVIIDTELMKAVVAVVEWGIIGGATPNGWNGSTEMTASAFDLEAMTFTVTDLELRQGEFKFRYGNNWKIIIDTTDSENIVRVNTNFGGTLDNLDPGGDNIQNDVAGLYTVELSWSLADGYTATSTKTGDLAMTDWTDVVLDAVGDGVSADNADAISDPSGWGWGNKLLADNDGKPTKDGSVYTWTWAGIILEADAGFKLRTEDGVAPSNGNGANFDSGFGDVDTDNSSANVADSGGNISVTVKASYNITMTIDAADGDAKKIVITEAK